MPAISDVFQSIIGKGLEVFKGFGFGSWDQAIEKGQWWIIFRQAARTLPREKQEQFFEAVFSGLDCGERLKNFCLKVSDAASPPFSELLKKAELEKLIDKFLQGIGIEDAEIVFTDSVEESVAVLKQDKEFRQKWAGAWSKTFIIALDGGHLDLWTAIKQIFEQMYGNILVGNDALAKSLVPVIQANITLAALSLIEESSSGDYPLTKIIDIYEQGVYPLGIRDGKVWVFCSYLDER